MKSTTTTQDKNIILMFSADVMKFFNRIGVRPVGEDSVHTTDKVTADMEPKSICTSVRADALTPVIMMETLKVREESFAYSRKDNDTSLQKLCRRLRI